MTAPDYAAEARRWLEGEPHCLNPAVHGSPCGCFNEDSLAKLLERLCGEAAKARGGCEVCWHVAWCPVPDDYKSEHGETVGKDRLGLTVRCDYCWLHPQLSEARAEVTKLRAELDLLERLKFLWTESADGSARQRERAEAAEAALEQARDAYTRLREESHAFTVKVAQEIERAREEGRWEQWEKDAGIAESFEDQYRTGITIAQAIRGER